jgi:hypothetical protein
MSVQLLVIYPPPKDPVAFERAYREEHLPYAGPRLLSAGATGVTTKRVLGSPGGTPSFHWISFIEFPTTETAQASASPKVGKRRFSMQPLSLPADSHNIS